MKRAAAFVVLLAYGLNLGCSTVREIPVSDVQAPEKVAAVVCRSGEVVEFNDDGGVINSYRGTADGVTTRGAAVSIPLSEVTTVRAPRTDTTKSVLWTVAVIGAVAAVVAAIVASMDSSSLSP